MIEDLEQDAPLNLLTAAGYRSEVEGEAERVNIPMPLFRFVEQAPSLQRRWLLIGTRRPCTDLRGWLTRGGRGGNKETRESCRCRAVRCRRFRLIRTAVNGGRRRTRV